MLNFGGVYELLSPTLSIDGMSGITICCSQRRKNMELEAILPVESLQDCWLYPGYFIHLRAHKIKH